MLLIRVGSAVINQTPLDWEGNRARIISAIEEAKSRKVGLLCLPELCVTGYGCEDQFFSSDMQDLALQSLREIARKTRGIAVSVGLPIRYKNALYNCACMMQDGKILGFVAKQHLAGDGIHYEPRWFKEWPAGAQVNITVPFELSELPLGDVQFSFGGILVGYEVCEDAWVASRPGASLAKKGVDIILNPSASHFAFGKYQTRHRFVIEGSRAFGATYVYSNLLGNEAGRAIYDGGALIATAGRLVAQGKRFSYKDFELTTAVVDIEETRTIQTRTASFHPSYEDSKFVRGGSLPKVNSFSSLDVDLDIEYWEMSENLKEEEFERAACLGLFDYIRKSHVTGVVISLSGGADSTACALIAYEMIGHAWEGMKADGDKPVEIARQKAMDRLLGKKITLSSDWYKGDVGMILTTVYQATKNSSFTTREAARAVAHDLGATHMVLDVDPMVDQYVEAVEKALGRKLSWETDDVALQNIQARVRSPSVWMIANIKGALLIPTSNRSEAAVGYCTMDGDTSGSLSLIAGIDKNFLRHWLEYKSQRYSSLKLVTQQQPTAELRPEAQKQTDEKDLMPYDVLNLIEGAAVRDKKSPLEVFHTLQAGSKYDNQDLLTWITRFFRLWCRNQWKRERYAPSFHFDDKNLDPRSWCRFPILSSGFEYELGVLSEYVMSLESKPSLK